ncbi:MAG: glycosyltransferase [Maribacter sp.]
MTKRKNICITINSLASGGAEKQSLLLAKALKPHHDVIFVILKPQPIYQPRFEVLKEEAIEHIFLPKNPVKKGIAFTRLLKRRKIDIIFSFLPTDTILSAICGKMAGVPHIFGGIRNSYIPKIKYSLIKIIHNYLLSYTIANNYAAYSSSIGFGFKKKVFVIPNGIEIKPFFARQGLDRKTITIISLGRLVKQKDYETALKGISELKKTLKTDIKLKYRIVGHGPEKETITSHIKQYDLQEEVEIISNPPNIYGLLESSDIYLSTSIFEGFSNSIMEAMNCGLPVVATDAGDNSRLVIHNKNGFITELADYKKIGEHLRYLIDSQEERHQMGLESYNHLVQSFSYSVFQKKYLNIIKNIENIQIEEGEYIVQK